jgi:tetratricopeptide (TPR) repeat protein
MAWALNAQRRYAEAVPYGRQALMHDESELGPDHPHVASATLELAKSLSWSEDPADLLEAEQLYRQAIALWRATRAAEDPSNLVTQLQALATFLSRRGRYAEAAPLYEEAWAVAGSCEHPFCADYQAEAIVRAIVAYAHWTESEPAQAPGLLMWKERLHSFEEQTRLLPEGSRRTCAARGLARTLSEEFGLDGSWPARAAFWRDELSRCERLTDSK